MRKTKDSVHELTSMLQEIRNPLVEIMVSSVASLHDEIFLTPPESQNASLSTSINVPDASVLQKDRSDTCNCISLDLDVDNLLDHYKTNEVTDQTSLIDKTSLSDLKDVDTGKRKDGSNSGGDKDKNIVSNTSLSECAHGQDCKDTNFPENNNVVSSDISLTEQMTSCNETLDAEEQAERPPKPKKILGFKNRTSKKRKQPAENKISEINEDQNETTSTSTEISDLKSISMGVDCNDNNECTLESKRIINHSEQNSTLQDNTLHNDLEDTYHNEHSVGDLIADVTIGSEKAVSPSKENAFNELIYWSIPIPSLSGSDISLKDAAEECPRTILNNMSAIKEPAANFDDKVTSEEYILQEQTCIQIPTDCVDSINICSNKPNETANDVTLVDYCDKLATDIISNIEINVSDFSSKEVDKVETSGNISSEHCVSSELSIQDTLIKECPTKILGRQIMQSVENEDGTISRKISMEDDPIFFDPITDALDELKLCVSEFCEVCLQELHAL